MEALVQSLAASVHARVIEHEGVPFAMYGVCPSAVRQGQGVSWLLGTDDLSKHSIWFLRNCDRMLAGMHEHFATFGNLADERNTVHVNWLKWAGFTFGGRIEHGGTHFLEHWRTAP